MSDQLYYNGDIITMEDNLYANAILVRDGIIIGVGDKDYLIEQGDAEIMLVDLEGHTLMPSFIDAHSHFTGYANSLLQISLNESISFNEIKESILGFINKNKIEPGKWIVAVNYDHNSLIERKHPPKELLDSTCPNNPCVLQHQSGHMGVFNSLALKELGIESDTGYLEETPFVDALKLVPMSNLEDIIAAVETAQTRYASYGITTVQEGFIIEPLVSLLLYLQQENKLKLDLIGYLDIKDADNLTEKFQSCIKRYKNHIKIGGYKTFLDGSPQGRTAWMQTPYLNGDPSYCGYPVYQDNELIALIRKSILDNMQLLVHSNGDAAAKQYIDIYRSALDITQSRNNIRPVMIHAQLLRIDQLDAVKELHMIPSFFIAHVYYWGDTHIENFGFDRASQISPARAALEKNILFTFHQDSPVIEPNMLDTIWCAVNRITKNGVQLGTDECISPLDALKAVTVNAAYQYFEEDIKGSIREGKLADLVILEKNPLKVDKMEIKDIKVINTIKEGVIVYAKAE